MSQILLYKGRGKDFLRAFRNGEQVTSLELPGRLCAFRRKLDERARDEMSDPRDLSLAMENYMPFIADVAERLAAKGLDYVFVREKPPSGWNRECPELSPMVSHIFIHYVWEAFEAELEGALAARGRKLAKVLLVKVRSEKNAVFSYDGRPDAGKAPYREKLVPD